MSETGSTAPSATLGQKNLSTIHAVAQSLAIGPMFSTALILGLVSNPGTGAAWNATLAILLAGLGVLAIGYAVTLYARRFAGAGAVYEYLTHGAHPWVGVLTAGVFFLGTLFLGGGGIYLGVGLLSEGAWQAHISDNAPAWWVFGLIGLAIVLVLNHLGVRVAVRAMLTFAAVSFVPMLILAVVIIAKGGEDGISLSVFNPSETSWFGVTGGGVLGGVLLGILLFVGFEAAASIGEESHDPHRSIPRAVLFTIAAVGRLLRRDGLRVLDGIRQDGGERGRVGGVPGGGQRDGDEVHRLVVRGDPRRGRDPGRDGPRARDLRDDRPRLLRALARRAPPEGVLEDVALRHAVGRQPDGRGRGHRPDARLVARGLPGPLRRARRERRPRADLPVGRVRDVHPLGDDRLVRRGGRVPDPRGRRLRARPPGGEQALAVRRRRGRGGDPAARLLRRPQARRRTTAPT